MQPVIKTTTTAQSQRKAKGSVGIEQDMPFETVAKKVKAPKQRKRKGDSDDLSDDLTDPDWIESDEDVQTKPAAPAKQAEKSKPAAGGKKAAAKAAAAQK